ARLLLLEAQPEQLGRAMEALARDTNFGGDLPASPALGVARPASRATNE
ncbi:MAG: hypothetical protein HZA53_10975, partial [Planctomycetes bacterium]|nr:hypothetical protein [Planctomycetota bacterium]